MVSALPERVLCVQWFEARGGVAVLPAPQPGSCWRQFCREMEGGRGAAAKAWRWCHHQERAEAWSASFLLGECN